MKKFWRWFLTGEWQWAQKQEQPSWAGKILACDLCGEPKLMAECKSHKLILCEHCSIFHGDHSRGCVLALLEPPTPAERIAYAQRYDAI